MALSAGDQGILRRSLVCIATGDYESPDAYPRLKVAPEVAVVRRWLLDEDAVDPPYADLSPPLNPRLADIRAVFRDSDGAGRFRYGDAVFVYVTGHGISGEGGHRLILSRTQPGVTGTALQTVELISALKDGGVDHAVVVVDTCRAAQTASDLATYDDLPAGWLVLFTAAKQGNAGLGVFSRALADFLQTQRQAAAGILGPSDEPYLNSLDFVRALNDALHVARQRLVTVGQLPPSWEHHPCLVNPGYDPRRAAQASVSTRSRDFATTVADLDAHWSPKARGCGAKPDADLFTGRHWLMAKLLSFVRGAPGLLVLTGRAGSGKSAVLSRLVTLSDPVFAAEHADLLAAVPEMVRPAHTDVDAAVVATGKTVAQVLEQAVQALGGGKRDSVEDLVEAVSGYAARAGRPATIVVDAVDESLQAGALVEALAALGAGGDDLRLVVGVRGQNSLGASPEPLMGAPSRIAAGWQSALEVSCDEAPAWDDKDLVAYARRSLCAGPTSPYQDTTETAAVAKALAVQARRSFLLVQLATRALAAEERPRRPDDPGLAVLLGEGLASMLRDDVARAVPDPTERAATVDLLAASAFSVGRGVPWRGIWPRLATAVASDRPGQPVYGDSDAAKLLAGPLSGYLTRDEEDGEALFRPFHEALAGALRDLRGGHADQVHETDDGGASVHARIVGLLRPLLNVPGPRPTADMVPPYIRRHLVDHAERAGTGPDLLRDPAVLSMLLPTTADRLADSVDDPAVAAVLHRIAEAPAAANMQHRSAELELWSRQMSASHLADVAGRLAVGNMWRATWADWSVTTPHRTLTRLPRQTLLASWEDEGRGDTVMITEGPADVRLVSATMGETLARQPGQSASAVAVEPSAEVVAIGTNSGAVALVDAFDLTSRVRWQAHFANVTAVAFAEGPAGRMVLTAGQREVSVEQHQAGDRYRSEVACWRLPDDGEPEQMWRTPAYGTAVYSILVHEDQVVVAGDAYEEGASAWALLRVLRLTDGSLVSSIPHASRGVDEAVRVPGHPGVAVVRRSGSGLFLVDLDRLNAPDPRFLEMNVAVGAPLAVLPQVPGVGGPFIITTVTGSAGVEVVELTHTAKGLDFAPATNGLQGLWTTHCQATTVAGRSVLLSNGYDGIIRRTDAATLVRTSLGAELAKDDNDRLGMGLLKSGPAPGTVVCLGRDSRIEVRGTVDGGLVARSDERFAAAQIATVLRNGKPFIAVVGADQRLYLLDPATDLALAGTLDLFPDKFEVSRLVALPHEAGSRLAGLAAGSEDGQVGVWDVNSGTAVLPPVRVSYAHKRVNALTELSGALLVGCGDGSVSLLDPGVAVPRSGGTEAAQVSELFSHRDWVRTLAVLDFESSPVVVSAGDDGSLYISDPASGTTAELAAAHDGKPITALVDLGGSYLGSGGHDGCVRLWQWNRRAVLPLKVVSLDSPVRDLYRNGELVVASTDAGIVGLELHLRE